MSNQRIAPPPRPSGQTVVGLGAVEHRATNRIDSREDRDEAITPQSGTDMAELHGLLSGDERSQVKALFWISSQIGELRAELQRCDVVTGRAAAHAEHAERFAEATGMKVGAMAGDLASVSQALMTEVIPRMHQLDDIASALARLEERLGDPPHAIDLSRASLVREHTAAELTAMEREGTGLFAVVSRLIAGQSRLWRRVAIGAGVSAAAAPVAIEIIKALIGGGW